MRRTRADIVNAYVAAMKDKGVVPTATPEAWRRALTVGDIAAVLYPSQVRTVVRVLRLTGNYVWCGAAKDTKPIEWGYSFRTGLIFCGGGGPQKNRPILVPATDAEKADISAFQLQERKS